MMKAGIEAAATATANNGSARRSPAPAMAQAAQSGVKIHTNAYHSPMP